MERRFQVLAGAAAVILVGTAACVALGDARSPLATRQAPSAVSRATIYPGAPCEDPVRPGKVAIVEGMAIMVNAVARPADGALWTASASNPTAGPGSEFILVSLSATCSEPDGGTCSLDPSLNFALLGASGVALGPEAGITGLPGMLERGSFPAGSTIYGAMVFEVGWNETDLLLVYSDASGSRKACLVVPSWLRAAGARPIPSSTPAAEPTPEPTATATPAPGLTPTPAPAILLPQSGGAAGWPVALCVLGSVMLLCGFVWQRLRGK